MDGAALRHTGAIIPAPGLRHAGGFVRHNGVLLDGPLHCVAPAGHSAPPSASLFAVTSSPTASIEHYENFPVASWLCPPHLRAPITAIYHYARTADDLADEGTASAKERITHLQQYRRDLHAMAAGAGASHTEWPHIFAPLQRAVQGFNLPIGLLDDLLDAFLQDVEKTAAQQGYADRAQLLDYCRRSANPVGRLLLHLYGIDHPRALAQSDAICSALQLINFWQDLSEDVPRGRWYLPEDACAQHQVTRQTQLDAMRTRLQPPALTALIAQEVAWAKACMHNGQALVHALPGRAGWELRLVVQGGLAIVRKLERQGFQSLVQRPTVGKADLPAMLIRAVMMRAPKTQP